MKHNHKKKHFSRREFLGTASCAAVGTTTFFSTLFNLGMANAMAAPSSRTFSGGGNSDYKALVCILLAGGNDSFNMLVPRGVTEHAEYANTRSNLALARNTLLPINPLTYNTQQLGLHPSMPEAQSIFEAGRLAFVSNVGTLVEPTTKAAYQNGSAMLPSGLLSHSDQIQQWQTSVPQSRNANGWGGRMADILQSMNSNQDISMSISLSGRNVFQSGTNTAEYTITSEGSKGIIEYGDTDFYNQLRTTAINSLLEQNYQDIFKKTYADVTKTAQDNHGLFSSAVNNINLTTAFSTSELSQSMQMIAKTIAARDTLGMSRQTFFVSFGGWDHHDEVLNAQNAMLGVVSKALGEFDAAMTELGVQNNVTTFTISDFARTLTSNGNGTDHAWGGNVMVMGGDVKGKEIYGAYPSLALNTSLDIGDGVLIPSMSTDEYFAELALWFGVQPTDLPVIFPNIGKFYSHSSGMQPVGFMTI